MKSPSPAASGLSSARTIYPAFILKAHPAEEFHQYSCHWKTNSGIIFGMELPTKYMRLLSGCKWLHLCRDQAPEESEHVLYKGGERDTRNMGIAVAAYWWVCI